MSPAVARVDLNDFVSGSSARAASFVDDFGSSLAATGFVRVAGHAVDRDTLDAAYRSAARVFALDESTKSSYSMPGGARGFIAFGTEQAKDATIADLKEFWHIGREHGGSVANWWPDEVAEFKPAMNRLFRAMDDAASHLLRALALAMGLPERFLADMCDGADSLLRVLHYPPLNGAETAGAVRAAAHEDINFITLLPAATDAGLELLDRDGNWVNVDGDDGELIVDTGDMMHRILNGHLPATTHRVVNPDDSGRERYSMPFFCQPRGDVSLTPPPELLEPGERLIADPITAGDYHRQRMEQIRLK